MHDKGFKTFDCKQCKGERTPYQLWNTLRTNAFKIKLHLRQITKRLNIFQHAHSPCIYLHCVDGQFKLFSPTGAPPPLSSKKVACHDHRSTPWSPISHHHPLHITIAFIRKGNKSAVTTIWKYSQCAESLWRPSSTQQSAPCKYFLPF